MDLPDVNLWLAFTDPNHAQHPAARKYWDELRSDSIAFNRITMLGLLRLATSNAVMQSNPFALGEIWSIYQTYRAMPIVSLLPEPAGLESTFAFLTENPEFFPPSVDGRLPRRLRHHQRLPSRVLRCGLRPFPATQLSPAQALNNLPVNRVNVDPHAS